MSNAFAAPHFNNDEAARNLIQSVRWPDGPVCSHCGVINHAYAVTGRAGLYRCAEPECRKDFTCTTGTVMERSKIALHKWMMGFYLMNASKKGVSAHQMHRALGVTYQSAWFMCHRIREAMRDGGFALLGGKGGGGIVEADETYFGKYDAPRERKTKRYTKPTKGGKSGPANKRAILSLVERGGRVRSFHIPTADKATVDAIVKDNIARESRLHTDESRLYFGIDQHFADHETVKHTAEEYVRGDVTTNTVENYFSVFKRGMRGVYQHCAEKHLHRYLAEFDFRYNNRAALGVDDANRANALAAGIVGKRLTYRRPNQARV